jgi:hypothetical protein
MDFVPVEPVFLVLVVEEAILGVDDFPQGFEVPLRGIVRYFFGDAGWEKEDYYCHPECSEGSRGHKGVDVFEILHFTSFRSDELLRTPSE